MDYMEVDCKVEPAGEQTEILIARLSEIGYEMFEETDCGVKAYIPFHLFNQVEIDAVTRIPRNNESRITYTARHIPAQNWNETWERSYQPVVIGGRIHVRASWHVPSDEHAFDLVIDPRMAFGTGHHATTSLVMEAMLDIDFKGKSVLDMGCGTGILSILAGKMGASFVLAVDIDPQAVENAADNCKVNDSRVVEVVVGDASIPGNRKFDLILANINRNIILDSITRYAAMLNPGGLLITSGYYLTDLPAITSAAVSAGLRRNRFTDQDNWCCAVFVHDSSA